jgi:hypothetical protein
MSPRQNTSTTTGGSDERAARAMSGPLLRFELLEEAATLRTETSFVEGDRNARTLTKAGAFRLVLVVFRAGATFDENDQRGTVCFRFWTGGSTYRSGKTGSRSAPAKSRSCRPTILGKLSR